MALNEMEVMDPTGHTTVAWDPGVPAEVEAARTTFNDMTTKGYQAFRVGKRGQQADRLTSFDAAAEQMILVPQLRGG